VSRAAIDKAQTRDSGAPMWTRRRVALQGGVAASIAAAGIVGATLWKSNQDESFATGIGQVREILLADGSIVTLNTNTKVSVRFTDENRKIHLLQGEAFFSVAKNKNRPFIVLAGNTQVRAVGTSFSVSMLPRRPTEVLVKEGVVELKRVDRSTAPPIRVSANTQVLTRQDAQIVAARLPEAKLVRSLAWQYGRIAFDNQKLQDAADEFARYSDIRIAVAPSVASRTVTGLFASNDPIGFAKTVAAVLELQVEVSDREVRLFGRADERPVGKS
jgi:transmembrane sensor